MLKFLSRLVGLLAVLGIAAWSQPGFADPISDDNLDPLYAFCYGSTSCSNNGSTTPTVPSSQLNLGFYIVPGPNTGYLFIDILIPTNEDPTPSAVSFAIAGTQGGAAENASLSAIANLFSTTSWHSGQLTTYLNLTIPANAPPNKISSWLPSTQAYDPGATGYYVYQADLGINELRSAKNESLGPLLSVVSLDQELLPELPEGAMITGYLNTPSGSITTAQSGPLLIDSPVPEPGSLAIFGVALLSLAAAYRCKRA